MKSFFEIQIKLAKYEVPPLKAVGWEGIFGLITLSIILVPMNTIIPDSSVSIFYNTTNGHLEDIVDAFDQFQQNPTTLAMAFCGVMVKKN